MALNDLAMALKVKATVRDHGKAYLDPSLSMYLDKRGQPAVGPCFIP